MINLIKSNLKEKRDILSDLYLQVRVVFSPSNTERYLLSEMVDLMYYITKDQLLISLIEDSVVGVINFPQLNRIANHYLKDIRSLVLDLDNIDCNVEYRIKANQVTDSLYKFSKAL